MSRPLTNDDFRKILATPVVRSGASGLPADASKEEEETKKKRKFYKPKKPDANKPKESKPKYRDRAAERRDGVDEYANEAAPDVSAAESAYLGGDVEHTHLVKGLDVALLEKVKAENERKLAEQLVQQQAQQQKSEQQKAASKEQATLEPVVDSLAYRISQVIMEQSSTNRPPSAAAALFGPGRMGYMYDIRADAELPTKQIRGVVSGSASRSRKTVAAVHPTLVEEVANVLTYGGGGASTRPKRDAELRLSGEGAATRHEPTPEKAKAPRNKEDDIFAEDSLEDGEVKEESQQPALGMQKAAGYITYLNLDEAEKLPKHLQALRRKVEAAQQAEEKKEAARKKKEEEDAERSKAAASKVSTAQRGFQAYFQRRETDLAKKDAKFSDADLQFDDTAAIAPTTYGKVIVEEDDEVDDAVVIDTFKQGLEVFEGQKGDQRGAGRGKRTRKGRDKQKVNQDMEKLAKVIKDQRPELVEMLAPEGSKKKPKKEEEGADAE